MSKWKEYPNLFANGKFSVMYNDSTWDLIGIENDYAIGLYRNDVGNTWQRANDCKLIARPISDMSDEEINNAPLEHNLHEQSRKWCIHDIETNMWADILIYLLSIGVYPFDQSEFNNDDLIATYKNKQQ